MSDGIARSFWKRNRAVLQIGFFVAAIAAAVAIPFIQEPLCAVADSESNPATYEVTVERPYHADTEAQPESPSLSKFTFGASVGASNTEIEHTESRYYAAQQKEDWRRKYWCDVNASDYFLVLFTLALAVSTFFLWRETERLAEGADDQAKKMQASIDATQLMAKNILRAQRPLIVSTNVRFGDPKRKPSKIVVPGSVDVSLYCDYANRGNAVGYLKAVWFEIDWGDTPGPISLPSKDDQVLLDFMAVKPDAIFMSPEPAVPSLRVDEKRLFAGHDQMFVHGWVRYTDVHQVMRRSGFCYVAYPDATLKQDVKDVIFTEAGPAEYWYDIEEDA